MNAIKEAFLKAKANGDGLLIGYVTAGDPTPEETTKIAQALIKGGVDILELGLPFSDPIADGPTIQAASLRALNAGTTPRKVLEIAKEIKSKHDVPVAVMTYYNPVFHLGLDGFLASAKEHGVDGFIVPDLPMEEADAYRQAAQAQGIDTIFLAAPSTTAERLQRIIACSSGFLYLVSHFGVTGAKASIEDSALQLVRRVKSATEGKVPLAVGFGISQPEHVRSVLAAGADGVIVGSALVNIVSRNLQTPQRMLSELENAARSLKKATRR
jgi:tryptophan synthase alpha chain